MKTKLTFVVLTIFGTLIAGCKQREQKVEVEEVKIDLVNDEFPESKQEVMETFDAIVQSIKDGDLDKLISFHANGPRYTEFKNGEPSNGGEANEDHKRNVFGSVTML